MEELLQRYRLTGGNLADVRKVLEDYEKNHVDNFMFFQEFVNDLEEVKRKREKKKK